MRARINLAVPVAVLLALGCVGCTGGSSSTAARLASQADTGACDSLATCYSPAQIRVAYGIQPLTDQGIDGRGETVVLPELAEHRLSPGAGAGAVTSIRQDLAGFDKRTRPLAAGSATGSRGPATRTAYRASVPPGACPTWPPTPMVTPAWRWSPAQATAGSTSAITAAPVAAPRSGRESSLSPTSTRATAWGLSIPPVMPSPAPPLPPGIPRHHQR